MPFAHFFHCVLILFILTCKLGILRNLVLCYVCCIEVLGHHEEMEQNKHTTTQWIENIAASRKAANLFSSSPPNVTELLPSHSQPLSNEDLIEVQEKRCKEKLPWKLPPPPLNGIYHSKASAGIHAQQISKERFPDSQP